MRPWPVAVVFLLAALAGGAAVADPDDSPAAKRVRELVDVINAADRAGAEKFVRESYGPEFLKEPMDVHLGFLAEAYGRTRGLEVEGVESQSPTEATATVRSKLSGERMAILVRVEAEPPHRITGIGRRPVKAAGDANRELTEQQAVQELKAHVQKLADADAFSGVVLLARDGKPILLDAWGQANKDFAAPNRTDTKFNLGSMNKMFTAVATLQLVERGRLSLEDPLARFLPDFPSKEAAEKIQIKHLLTHTSGLGSYFNQKFKESSRARWRTVDQMLELAKDEQPQFAAGEKWSYSNTGFLVLGKVIEKVTGQDYYAYVRENVYKPAGMTGTGCYELDRVNPNLAVGYEGQFGKDGVTWRNNLFEHVIRGGPAGGGYSTAEDLLRFDRALRGGKLLGAQYVKTALSAKPEMKSPGYGFGFQIQQSQGATVAGHGGGFPGISSNLDMFLSAEGDAGPEWTCVILANYGGAAPPVVEKARELVAAVRRNSGTGPAAKAATEAPEAVPAAAADPAKERAALQGHWHAVAELLGGKATGEDFTQHRMILDGERFEIISGDTTIMAGRFEIDPTKSPRTIDFHIESGKAVGETTRAIYALEAGRLKICIPQGPESQERPTKFETADTQNMLVELERDK